MFGIISCCKALYADDSFQPCPGSTAEVTKGVKKNMGRFFVLSRARRPSHGSALQDELVVLKACADLKAASKTSGSLIFNRKLGISR